MIFDAVSRHESGVLSMESFRAKIGYKQPAYAEGLDEPTSGEDRKLLFPEQLPTLKETEQMLIDEALKRSDGNRTIAAQLLGLSRRALSNRLSRARK